MNEVLTMDAIGMYRVPTQYEGVYKYIAPEGYHFQSFNTNFGRVIWGGYILDNPYMMVKDEETES